VDLPGYGFSVAAPREQRRWDAAGLAYVRARAPLAAAVVVVDATRGLCGLDGDWLAALAARDAPVPAIVALSKGDLLPPPVLAAAARVVEDDVAGAAAVFPCCGTTGAGVDALWGALAAHAEGASERPHGARGVPIHRSALKKS
jgi:GTP-binding protein EngB required for normal cell division